MSTPKSLILPLLTASLAAVSLSACQNPSPSSGNTSGHAHGTTTAPAQPKAVLAIPQPGEVSQDSESFTMNVAKGGTAEVTLPFQAGTGYSWALASHSDGLTLVNTSTRSLSDDGRTGGPMEAIYVLKRSSTSNPGETATFKLSRPWEEDAPAARVVKVRFTDPGDEG